MAQIYERKDIYDDLAKNIGTGLQSLANYKLQQMHKSKETEENYNFLKTIYPEHVAKALASQPEKTRNEFLKNFEANPNYKSQEQQPSEQAQVAGGFKPDIPEDQLKSFVDYLNSPDSPDDFSELMKSQQEQQKPQMPGAENLIPQLKQQQPGNIPTEAPKSMAPIQPQVPAPVAAPIGQSSAPISAPAENEPAVIRRGSGANGQLTPKDVIKFAREDQKLADAETKKYYDNLLALDDAADASLKRLSKIENLVDKKGGLPISTFYKLFNKLEEQSATSGAATGAALGGLIGLAGGPISPGTIPAASLTGAAIGGSVGALLSPVATLLKSGQTFISPNTEEFEKLSNDFVREAKSIFGSRITDQDLQTFMSLVPTLSQTDNGKRAIIKNMRNFLKANQVKAKNMKRVIHANGGHRPYDLPLMVEELSKPELDKLAKQFEVD